MHWRTFLTVENVYHSQIREIISNPAIYRWRVRFLSYLPMTFSLDWEVIVPDVGVWSPTVITWHNTNQNQIPLSWNTIAHSFGGGITYRVRLLPKHKVSQTIPRLLPEIAPLIHLSPCKELSSLVWVTQAQCQIWSTCVRIRVFLSLPYMRKNVWDRSPVKASRISPSRY